MIYLTLLVSLLLRVISLNQSLWLDEATTGIVAQMSLSDFFTKFIVNDFHPPLYYLVVSLWTTVFGYSEISLRLPSVIFGVLTVYVTYLIAKQLKFKQPIIPALFLATSGLHVYYSQEARMYGMVTFLVSCLVLSYIRKKWIIFSLLLPLIFLTDYLAILVLAALFLHTFIFSRENIKKIIISVVPLFFAFIVWLPTFYNQLTSGLAVKASSSAWWEALGPVTFKNVALIPTKFILGRISFDDPIVYGLIVAVLFIFIGFFITKAKNLTVWSWFVGSLLLGILVSFFIPTLTYFRYLFILPAFYLLISENASKFIVVFVLCINLLSSGFYLLNSNFHREDWRQLVSLIGQDKIVLPAGSQKEALIYYGRENQIVSVQELATNDQQQLWLSRYVWNIVDTDDSTRKQIENLGYNWSEELNLNGLVFWKYTK